MRRALLAGHAADGAAHVPRRRDGRPHVHQVSQPADRKGGDGGGEEDFDIMWAELLAFYVVNVFPGLTINQKKPEQHLQTRSVLEVKAQVPVGFRSILSKPTSHNYAYLKSGHMTQVS